MEPRKTWVSSDNSYFLRDISAEEKPLDKGVYLLQKSQLAGIYLDRLSDRFDFDFKIYGLEKNFMERACKTWANTTGSMGVLLNGLKGGGKTVTAEILANKLDMPIILINNAYDGINTFLSSIPQDLTILIDEYEKVYKGIMGDDEYGDDEGRLASGDSSLLSLMSGTLETTHRKAFILTTNKLWINENLLNRPGRIRYKKEFGDLKKEQIMEIIDDCLVNKSMKNDVISFMKPLKIITVDIVKSIISEVNIFNETPDICCKDFNLEFKDETYSVIRIGANGTEGEVLTDSVQYNLFNNFISRSRGNSFASASIAFHSLQGIDMSIRNCKKPDLKDMVFTVYDAYEGDDKNNFKVKIEKTKTTHRSLVF